MRRPATALSAFTLMLAAGSDPATPPETSQETVGENYRFDHREPRGGTTIFWNSVARNLRSSSTTRTPSRLFERTLC